MTYTETTRRERTARKAKICAECKTNIEKGEIFTANSALENGKYTAMSRHMDCIEAADALDAEIIHSQNPRLFLKPMIEASNEPKEHILAILSDCPLVLERLNLSKGINLKD